MELNAVVGESSADVIAPVLKLSSCPLEFMVIVSEHSRFHIKQDVEFSVRCRDNSDFWLDVPEYIEWNFLKNIRVNVLDAKTRILEESL